MPRPSNLWFPYSLQDISGWFQNFFEQSSVSGTTYGLTLAEVQQIEDDNSVIQFMANAFVTMDAYFSNAREYRDLILELPVGQPVPPWPPNMALALPVVIPTGIYARVIDYAARIKASAAYTTAIGEAYAIVGTSPAPIAPGEVKPEISLSAAVHNYLFSIVVSNREDADAWQVWVKPGLATEFQMVATATGKSTDVTFNPGFEQPGSVQLMVYVQLRRNNADYGVPSEIGLVTVNP